MADQRTDSFIIPIQIEENVTNALKQLVTTTSKGVTIGISMESDAGKVIEDIHKISKELEAAIGKKDFNMDKLLNLNNAIAKLGAFKGEVEGLETIFNTLTSSVTSLNGAMTEIASVKMDTKQFAAFQNALSSIDANVAKIAQKLDGVEKSSSLKNMKTDADNAAKSVEKTAAATEKLNKVQKNTDYSKQVSGYSNDKLKQEYTDKLALKEKYLAETNRLDERKSIFKHTNVALSDSELEAGIKQKAQLVNELTQKYLKAGYINASGQLVKETAGYNVRNEINQLNETKKELIEFQQAYVDRGGDLAKLKVADIRNQDDMLRQEFDAYYNKVSQYFNNVYKMSQVLADEIKTRNLDIDKLASNATKTETPKDNKSNTTKLDEEKNKVTELVQQYNNYSEILKELTTQQLALQSNKLDISVKDEKDAYAQLLQKAEQFNGLISQSPEQIEKSKVEIQRLADEMKVLVSKSGNYFDNNRGSAVSGTGKNLISIYGESFKHRSPDKLKDIESKIQSIQQQRNSAAAQITKITGRTVDEILKEAQAQQQVTTAAKEAGDAQVKSGEKILENADAIEKKLKSVANTWKKVNIDTSKVNMSDPKAFKMEEGYHIPKSDLKNGVPTQASVKRALDSYLQTPSEESKQKLIAYVEALNDSTKAAIIFGKKNEGVFKEISAEIENTQSSLKAYQKYMTDLSKVLYKTVSPSPVGSQADEIESLVQKGDIKTAMQLLTQYCGKEKEVEQSIKDQVMARRAANQEVSTSAQPMQQVAQEAANTAANIEQVEQNLTEAAAKAEVLEKEMADVNAKAAQSVTGKVDIGNTVKVTGDGGQLALEKTLKATYHIQQNMVKILAEINSKMVSGANAAAASYEQLRTAIQGVVEDSKKLGADEARQKEPYTLMKQELTEILRLKKLLPNAGENEKKLIGEQINALYKQAGQRQKLIDQAHEKNEVEQQTCDILRKQIKLEEAKNKDAFASGTGKKTKLESKYNSVANVLRPVANNTLVDLPETQKIQELVQQVLKYDQAIADVGGDWNKLSSATKKEINSIITEFNKLTATQQKALKNGEYNEYNATGKLKGNLLAFDESQIKTFKSLTAGSEEYKAALVDIINKQYDCKLENVQLDSSYKVLTGTYRDNEKNLQRVTATLQDNVSGLRMMRREAEAHKGIVKSVFEPFGNKLKEIFRYFSAYMIVMRFFNAFKEGVNTVKELNTAFTELKVVTGETNAAIEKFEKQAQEVASSIASTTLEVTQSATEWARLGYTMSDSLELAAEAAKYAKVGFTDIDTATQNLTSTLQAFYADDIRKGIISAGDAAAKITDKLVYVGNKFASSAEGMGSGITAAGAALVAANNSLDESLAMITAGTTILQDEDETANALRTISMRLRGTKASELEEAGLETDGVVEDASKLYDIVKKMTSVNGGKGVEILDVDTGAYKSTYQILLEISKVWEDLNDQQQAGLLETLAGKTRANAAAAILSNGEILEEAYEASINSDGEAAKAMEETLNSIESHIAQLNQAISVMWENALDSEVVKGFVDLGTAIVKVIDKVGLLSTAFAGIAGYFGAKGQGRHTKQRVLIKYA